jgi:hypothetical protein
MKGDTTRYSFDPDKHFTAVLKQQGRVDLDSEWNEAADIASHLQTTESVDVIGACGVPKKTTGLKVGVKPDGSDLTLTAGRFYVKGTLCEVSDTTYATQPNLPNPPALAPKDGRTDLVYLEVWQRHITAIEDPDLLEPALGGADTTTRRQTVWQVKILPDVTAKDCKGDVGTWPPIPPLEKRGRLTAKATSSSTTTDPCLIAPGGGYRGLENRLYRVEIHDSGYLYAWPRPSGVAGTAASKVSGQKKKVKVTDWSLDGTDWKAGQTIELYNTQTDNAGKAGTLARITTAASSSNTLTLDTDISSLSASGLQVRRVATYKWSRDNGSVAFPIQEFVSGEPKKVRVKRLGRDQVLTVHSNDWVEVLGDTCNLWGRPGTMAAIAADGIDEAEMKLTLSADVSAHGTEKHPKLRRWDQQSRPQAVTGDEIELEDGIKIQFGGNAMQPGDYWCFAARTATGDIDTLTNAPSMGVERHFCRLALIQWKSGGSTTAPFSHSVVKECPPTFPPLTDIWAEDVFYDDGGCSSIEAENVQEAIDQLCAQRHLPHHNKHLHGWGIVCGLRVICGPEELVTPGDQVSVIVKPGYALDCEGKDIILEKEIRIAVIDMVKRWEKNHPAEQPLLTDTNGKLSGEVCLIIERDEDGKPRLDLRPYDPSADTLSSMLQGTLLVDFFRECVSKPLEEITQFILKPTGDFEKGSIVPPEWQQYITTLNLIWQLWKAEHGSHIFLSLKEHTILENLYYKLAEILASKTFCGMFHEDLFPDYPFPDHDITTLFGLDSYRRIRIHPGGELGYAIGTRGKIGVLDLVDDVLIAELTFPGGDALVQDVAFSDDGKQIYVVALSPGGDTLFATASLDRTLHTWGPVKPVCDHSFLTLHNTKDTLYGIARGKGLFSMDPDQEVIRPEPVGSAFHAVGHLVVDKSETFAYATDALDTDAAIRREYSRVVRIKLTNPSATGTGYSSTGLSGRDDIALSADGKTLFMVVDPQAGDTSGNKQLLVFPVDQPAADPTTVDLESNTIIRLLSIPGKKYLAISYEDCYWLRLLKTDQLTLDDDFRLPVQISPIGMAYGPRLEQTGPEMKIDRRKRTLRNTRALRIYVLNAISTTVTAFPESHLSQKGPAALTLPAGSAQFLSAVKSYRQSILESFLALVGGVLQSLKDCFCDRLLVDCPDCSSEDEVYLAKVTIRESEVYQVCNFAKRKYVKSFPTVDYWLSVLPVMPLLGKAVEKLCCMILPTWFQLIPKKYADIQFVQGMHLRQAYTLTQQQGIGGLFQNATRKTEMAGRIVSDWFAESLSQSVSPPVASVSQERVMGREIAAAKAHLAASNIEVTAVETYDPAQGLQNLQAVGAAPVDLRPGMKVTLYADRGVVRYFAVTERTDLHVDTLKQEVNAQKTEIDALKTRTEPTVREAAPSVELQALQNELKTIKEQTAVKDKELVSLRTKLDALEKKQSSDIDTLRKDLDLRG